MFFYVFFLSFRTSVFQTFSTWLEFYTSFVKNVLLSSQNIDNDLGQKARTTPNLKLKMQDILNDRIKHCLSHVAGNADECSVCAGTGKCRLYP